MTEKTLIKKGRGWYTKTILEGLCHEMKNPCPYPWTGVSLVSQDRLHPSTVLLLRVTLGDNVVPDHTEHGPSFGCRWKYSFKSHQLLFEKRSFYFFSFIDLLRHGESIRRRKSKRAVTNTLIAESGTPKHRRGTICRTSFETIWWWWSGMTEEGL